MAPMSFREKREATPAHCYRCERPVPEGHTLCECGAATPFMSFDERRSYEAQQWRSMRAG